MYYNIHVYKSNMSVYLYVYIYKYIHTCIIIQCMHNICVSISYRFHETPIFLWFSESPGGFGSDCAVALPKSHPLPASKSPGGPGATFDVGKVWITMGNYYG